MRPLERLLLVSTLVVAAAFFAGSAAGCNTGSRKGPDLIFSPKEDTPRTFDATVSSSGYAIDQGRRQPYGSTLVMRITQRVSPSEPDGLRLLRLTADRLRIMSGDQTQEPTEALSHQAKLDRFGSAKAIIERSPSGRPRPVGRQMTLETMFAYVQPVFTAGRPKLGASWQTTQTVPVPPGADMPFAFRYKVIGREDRGGRELWHIETSFATSGTAEKRDHYITTILIGWQRGTGRVWVDPRDLQAVEASVTWRSDMNRHTAGLREATFTRVLSRSTLNWREGAAP